MAIDAISTVNAGAAAAVTQATESLGKEAFLKLLITQLQYQDPLNPADSTQFTAQLAQFSSLEQLSNVNANLEALKLNQASSTNAQAVAFIGKEIVSRGNTIEASPGQSAVCDFELAAAARRATLTVYDATGRFVTDFEASSLASGKQTLTWNGRDRSGAEVPAGTYTFDVTAEGTDGKRVEATTYAKGRVTGVTFEKGNTYLLAGTRKIALGDVTQVLQAGGGN
jgi:flagellar basal-body rod modification protein FlgD